MKTTKWLKLSSLITAVYCALCVLSAGMIIYGAEHYDLTIFHMGTGLAHGWITGPVGILISALGLICYNKERKDPEMCGKIGEKWRWFLIHLFLDLIFWVGAGISIARYY